jgi:dihydroorotate dehydrogenase (fumarate)
LSVDSDLARGAESFPESSNFFPDLQTYNLGPNGYLELIRHAKESVNIPTSPASPVCRKADGCSTPDLWRQAGADAIKLNIYAIATDPAFVKRAVRIPLAVKLSPFFSAPANMGVRFDEARADGIVLFNRFYQPDFDIEHLEVTEPDVEPPRRAADAPALDRDSLWARAR